MKLNTLKIKKWIIKLRIKIRKQIKIIRDCHSREGEKLWCQVWKIANCLIPISRLDTFGTFGLKFNILLQKPFFTKIKNHRHTKILQAGFAKFPMNKTMRIMLICMIILFGLIFGYHIIKGIMLKKYMKSQAEPPVYVTTLTAKKTSWQDKITTVGNLRAIRGVNITTELAGMVKNIIFKPGATVKENEVLIELNTATDVANLQALESSVALAKIVYERDKAQYAVKAVSKAQVDADEADLKTKTAQALAQSTVVQKKIIKAPFAGRLGISQVNPGQYLNVGDPVTTLQQLDPIYVDFSLPQQMLSKIKLNQEVELKIDTYPEQIYKGQITTINPLIDVNTRNIAIEATVKNNADQLYPGMFGQVSLDIAEPVSIITLPQTAISYNPYGDVVYIISESDKKDDKGKPILKATQQFVKVGDTRGDQIAILEGVKENEVVVTSGQLKLKNGSTVIINNQIVPENKRNPKVDNHL